MGEANTAYIQAEIDLIKELQAEADSEDLPEDVEPAAMAKMLSDAQRLKASKKRLKELLLVGIDHMAGGNSAKDSPLAKLTKEAIEYL